MSRLSAAAEIEDPADPARPEELVYPDCTRCGATVWTRRVHVRVEDDYLVGASGRVTLQTAGDRQYAGHTWICSTCERPPKRDHGIDFELDRHYEAALEAELEADALATNAGPKREHRLGDKDLIRARVMETLRRAVATSPINGQIDTSADGTSQEVRLRLPVSARDINIVISAAMLDELGWGWRLTSTFTDAGQELEHHGEDVTLSSLAGATDRQMSVMFDRVKAFVAQM